jgi:hypothetical protein
VLLGADVDPGGVQVIFCKTSSSEERAGPSLETKQELS